LQYPTQEWTASMWERLKNLRGCEYIVDHQWVSYNSQVTTVCTTSPIHQGMYWHCAHLLLRLCPAVVLEPWGLRCTEKLWVLPFCSPLLSHPCLAVFPSSCPPLSWHVNSLHAVVRQSNHSRISQILVVTISLKNDQGKPKANFSVSASVFVYIFGYFPILLKYRVARNKMDHHAVCEHYIGKLLLNNGFILVECRCQRW